MLSFPNAKINIGLYITHLRSDGYHDLETVFYPVQLRDALELIDNGATQTSLHCSGLPVAGDPAQNLALQAWSLLQADFPGKVGPVSLYLHKLIPMGGGMGGGSADGAFMLAMLNTHFRLDLSQEQLEAYALRLGSDCPFFIRNRPAFATGRGELLQPLALDLSGYDIQLICPDIHVSTAAAFRGIRPAPASFDLRKITQLPVARWRDHIANDFETSVFASHPELAAIKAQLYAQGALYASMSGSGATLYGIFERGHKARIHTSCPVREFTG